MSQDHERRRKPPLDPAYTEAGIALTQTLMDAVSGILDRKDTDLAIDAMAATFIALLAAAQLDQRDAKIVLYRYAERIMDYGEKL
jgi:hypothetical protein